MKKILTVAIVFICILATMLAIGEAPLSAAPELPTTWYFAEGTTREGFFEYLSIQNPEADEAEVSITYMTNEGEVGPFVMIVPPVSRDTVLVNEQLDAGLDVSVKVESDKGLVVERLKEIYSKRSLPWKPAPFISHSDANQLWQAGVRTILLGPGELTKAHAPDESASFRQICLAAEIYYDLAMAMMK